MQKNRGADGSAQRLISCSHERYSSFFFLK